MVPTMAWIRHKLRDSEVWAKVRDDGALATDEAGRVEIVYKAQAGAKVYRASARNLARAGEDAIEIEVGAPAERKPEPPPKAHSHAGKPKAHANNSHAAPAHHDAIHVWTDGACTGNPGPAGVGVVIIDGDHRRELSEYLGDATNNIAELTAILRGLEEVRARDRTVIIYSDSAYSIGLLSKGWKAKANVDLVAQLRSLTAEFEDLRFVKVAGHSGIVENERTDELATSAVRHRQRRK
jgi:ribonuclease HI